MNSVSIDERADVINERGRFGDWEAELVEGNCSSKHALLTLTERVARYTLVAKVKSKHASQITEAMIKLFSNSGLDVELVTSDYRREFAGHEVVSDTLGIDFYFAHPYSPVGTRCKRKHKWLVETVCSQENRLQQAHR